MGFFCNSCALNTYSIAANRIWTSGGTCFISSKKLDVCEKENSASSNQCRTAIVGGDCGSRESKAAIRSCATHLSQKHMKGVDDKTAEEELNVCMEENGWDRWVGH